MQFRDKLGDKVIIIPRGESAKKYFEPQFLNVLPSQTVTWINRDRISHALASGEPNSLLLNKIFNGTNSGRKVRYSNYPIYNRKYTIFLFITPIRKG